MLVTIYHEPISLLLPNQYYYRRLLKGLLGFFQSKSFVKLTHLTSLSGIRFLYIVIYAEKVLAPFFTFNRIYLSYLRVRQEKLEKCGLESQKNSRVVHTWVKKTEYVGVKYFSPNYSWSESSPFILPWQQKHVLLGPKYCESIS